MKKNKRNEHRHGDSGKIKLENLEIKILGAKEIVQNVCEILKRFPAPFLCPISGQVHPSNVCSVCPTIKTFHRELRKVQELHFQNIGDIIGFVLCCSVSD